ncbi:MAG: undecaprenyl/decaprenyl-phosphate alpha-N-acetylglucosaminyl 1-phosphate transferase [Phycisphaeraceae bacterium]|nr:undecaprenyl/decaprenyl-phosphate alpha-N-acetylglucosaminyl 1-phosphate transferase [Phycisphaeraceae bacterium]MCB9848715.1 undecaprenyl/decaprenyl-phosphate alpha-N-acetylglucosaminyl 1-phosphate transferase [Phycisphaeraceae bacterium]
MLPNAAPIQPLLASPEQTLNNVPLGGAIPPEAAAHAADAAAQAVTRLSVSYGYIGVFIAAFLVTILATPLMRRLAIRHSVIDHPNDPRKEHKMPIAYLGGVAIFLGLLAGIAVSYISLLSPLKIITPHPTVFPAMAFPFSILLGMTLIMLAGLLDDVIGLDPRLKIAGMLLASAALAMNDIGVKVAAGVMQPLGALIGNESLLYSIPVPGMDAAFQIDIIYWTGTAIIAIFVLGACNASNLIDGLDGLLTGVTAIAAAGFLFLALGLAAADDGILDSSRVVLCMALLGACLGFLPHNFNPATIFMGDAGSLLLGYCSIVAVLSLGDTGRTPLVVAGLIIYLLPIIDTTLAIVRRKMAGLPMSAPDAQHLHHLLKRSLGVKGAVFVLYGIAGCFCMLGIVVSLGRARLAYVLAMVVASFILVTAIKVARIKIIEEQIRKATSLAAGAEPAPEPPARSQPRAERLEDQPAGAPSR